jgi:hypothetical protein
MSTMNQLIGFCHENEIRVENIIPIPLAFSHSLTASDDLRELLKYEEPDQLPPELVAALGNAIDDDLDEMCEALLDANLHGFVVKLATPIRTFHSDDHASLSWGYYTTKWFFVLRIEDLAAPAEVWLDDRTAFWRANSEVQS